MRLVLKRQLHRHL